MRFRIQHCSRHQQSCAPRLHYGTKLFARSSATDVRCKAFKEPLETLTPDEQQEWTRCVGILKDTGLAEEDADMVLRESFGWKRQKYWKRRMMNVPADEAQVRETLDFLRATGSFSDAEISSIALKFPQVFGCGKEQLNHAVATLEKNWKIKGKLLTNSIKRNPTLLGCVIDCYGDCAGDCERCWQRF